jgi:hypothetical protein
MTESEAARFDELVQWHEESKRSIRVLGEPLKKRNTPQKMRELSDRLKATARVVRRVIETLAALADEVPDDFFPFSRRLCATAEALAEHVDTSDLWIALIDGAVERWEKEELATRRRHAKKVSDDR